MFINESAAVENTFTVTCSHLLTRTTGKRDATCTTDGYSGDLVCKIETCGHVEKGHTISKLGHSYSNGVCTRCGAAAAGNTTSASTGDTANLTLWIGMICLAGTMVIGLVGFKRKTRN